MGDSPVVSARGSSADRTAPVVSRHAWQRLYERLTPAEHPEVSRRIARLVENAWRYTEGDYAIRLLRLAGQRNDAWSDQSNGDEVWAVVRGGDVKTVMLRRSSQPATAWALRVDHVVVLP